MSAYGMYSRYSNLTKSRLKLSRGQVWCNRCGYAIKVDMAKCFASGWPEHCGEAMTIDSPEERRPKA